MKHVLYAASLAVLLAAAPAYAQEAGEPTPGTVIEGEGAAADAMGSENTGAVEGEPGVASAAEEGAPECGDPGETEANLDCVEQEDVTSGSN
ncbi:hypothetical protein [Lutibaculum baratangense]|uniref:Uncharacterized protein n=1 Tax=Lutibaculum baratangense AMV1 TaxID=631454 RepID=V4R2M6_9HYPH|nr:hypothetical protein [Lutibaculum baratangense]ESR26207.1 hypothetical protein N177_1066 [Lutibaculum baratangense AMV1]